MNTSCCHAHLQAVRQLEFGYMAHRLILETGQMQIVFACWNKLQCVECGHVELVKWSLPAVFEPIPAAPVTWRGLCQQAWQKLRRNKS